ncbi:TIGR03000 domain-containing protein [Roseimaritima sediminicola]|uniref:TIGR03000 domain-containing protein n=1 Tax=Roseimaritima sediminicola TaxID=2662066 RepID=UPI0012983290|nr:TIGR03000 domain-containing protein [Roseimaritima sediminicola]
MKKLRFLAPAATLLAVFACSPVEAGWGSRGYHSGGSSGYASYGYASGGSSGGSYGSYGSSGGYSSYRSHGSYGSHGSSGGGLLSRLHAKIHRHIAAKRARHASHGSSGYVSYRSHGSSGYSSYGSSYGSRGYAGYGSSSHGSSGYASYRSYRHYSYASGGSSGGHSSGSTYSYAAPLVYQSHSVAPVVSGGYDSGTILDQPYSEGVILDGGQVAPQADPAPQDAPAPADATAPEAAAPAEARLQADAALITVAVPATARVTVNGHPTTSEGPIRQFMSRGLKAGYTYAYEIVVEDESGGQTSRETKTLRVRAGDKERLVFAAPQAESVETALTVHVPDDAKVTLAGNATAAEGQTRVFRTSQLREGEVWDGYEIAVTVVREGREVTKKKTLRLVAGSEQELAFDFAGEAASAKLAAR